jgi:endothelin-converting enzyme/putative endopeptidase
MRHPAPVSLIAATLAACAGQSQKATAPAPKEQQHGVQLSDIDRSANPCTDFFQFANGAWRKANPIPGSMQRWSRRWQAGEQNKERLKDILEEVSKKSDWPRGSVEQIVGDDYASCMDEARAEAQGIQPIQPMLAQLDAMKTPGDLQKAIRRLQDLLVLAPFAFGAQPDQHEPSRTVADIGASGLGLPDRDYYLKPEPRFADAREKYLAHVQRMLELAGQPGAKEAAQTVFAFEKRRRPRWTTSRCAIRTTPTTRPRSRSCRR